MCLHIGGHIVGNFAERLCIFRALSEHLVTLTSVRRTLWAPVLTGLQPHEQFQVLDACFFTGAREDCPESLRQSVFFTNVSETFDAVKGFLLSPNEEQVLALVQWVETGALVSRVIPYTVFASVAAQLAQWLREQERVLLGKSSA